jgi:hypothetical protein
LSAIQVLHEKTIVQHPCHLCDSCASRFCVLEKEKVGKTFFWNFKKEKSFFFFFNEKVKFQKSALM